MNSLFRLMTVTTLFSLVPVFSQGPAGPPGTVSPDDILNMYRETRPMMVKGGERISQWLTKGSSVEVYQDLGRLFLEDEGAYEGKFFFEQGLGLYPDNEKLSAGLAESEAFIQDLNDKFATYSKKAAEGEVWAYASMAMIRNTLGYQADAQAIILNAINRLGELDHLTNMGGVLKKQMAMDQVAFAALRDQFRAALKAQDQAGALRILSEAIFVTRGNRRLSGMMEDYEKTFGKPFDETAKGMMQAFMEEVKERRYQGGLRAGMH